MSYSIYELFDDLVKEGHGKFTTSLETFIYKLKNKRYPNPDKVMSLLCYILKEIAENEDKPFVEVCRELLDHETGDEGVNTVIIRDWAGGYREIAGKLTHDWTITIKNDSIEKF